MLNLTHIPANILSISNYKHILKIIDHFSKLAKSYLLKSKNSQIILDYIKDFINMETLVGTYNGR